MRTIGALLLTLGIIGLLLNLIFWLPAEVNLIVVAIISIVCVLAIWGGGTLAQAQTMVVKEPARTHQPVMQQGTACPKCGRQCLPGQQFCGACGSSLASHCRACGMPISQPSKFCGNCGASLG